MEATMTIPVIKVLVQHLDLMEQIRREATYTDSLRILRDLIGSLKVDKGLAAQQRDLARLEEAYPNEAELLTYLNSEACHKLVLAHLHDMGHKSLRFDGLPIRHLLRIIRNKEKE